MRKFILSPFSSHRATIQLSHPPAPVEVKAGGVKPYVRCPSAMLCVQRANCDFDGVITEDPLDIGPDLEMLRVPLIVSPLQMESSVLISCV